LTTNQNLWLYQSSKDPSLTYPDSIKVYNQTIFFRHILQPNIELLNNIYIQIPETFIIIFYFGLYYFIFFTFLKYFLYYES